MTDLSPKLASGSTKLVGSNSSSTETNPVGASSLGELYVSDAPQQAGVNTTLNLTTSPIVGKVGASALADRKYIEMQALTGNVKWGYDNTCPFDLFKNQFFSLPASAACVIYFKASTGTAQVAFAEK